MAAIIIILAVFIVLDLVAWRFGFNSTDSISSCEWDRRQHWQDETGDQLVSC